MTNKAIQTAFFCMACWLIIQCEVTLMDSFSQTELTVIGHVRSDFPTKFGVPRQSGLCRDLLSQLVFEPPYNSPDAFRGIEDFSHIWVLWGFSDSVTQKFSPTVRPPKLGGNTRLGVFATRSPFRPNAIALSCVKLERVIQTDGKITLEVSGADMKNGTPILDIKPYIPYADSIADAKGSFASEHRNDRLTVDFPSDLLELIPQNKRAALNEVLSLDPRPAYHTDEQRVYGFNFAGFEVRFKVRCTILTVVSVSKQPIPDSAEK